MSTSAPAASKAPRLSPVAYNASVADAQSPGSGHRQCRDLVVDRRALRAAGGHGTDQSRPGQRHVATRSHLLEPFMLGHDLVGIAAVIAHIGGPDVELEASMQRS